tara:strand:+ start:1879 stop:2757 length:879 start_codon:yes stop_codon:yes gene_type:complete
MNQIVYYKFFIVILFSFTDTYLYGKLLRPSKDRDQKEILIINSKRRVYYPLRENGLVYQISGPTRAEFISRYPVLKGKKKSHSFNYVIVLNEKDTIQVKHRYKVQSSIRSAQHPKHRYTYSGNYFINLPKGNHSIEVLEDQKLKYPVLLRLLSKEFESIGSSQTVLKPMVHKDEVKIDVGDKQINYFECSKDIPLQIQASGPKKMRIISRLEFTDKMGSEESYRVHIKKGKKVVGTYFFNSERSSSSSISSRLDRVPGKWRSCEINIPKGKHTYSIEILDEGKTVLTRFILY